MQTEWVEFRNECLCTDASQQTVPPPVPPAKVEALVQTDEIVSERRQETPVCESPLEVMES